MRLILLGDVMLGRLVNDALRTVPPDHPWGNTLAVLLTADAVICNLECVIADRGRPEAGKTFTFRSDAKNVETLVGGRCAAVSLANNHALDYGADALLECEALLEAAGIRYAGAGRSLASARRPAICDAGGASVALVACTDNEPRWEAGPDHPGIFFVPLWPADSRLDDLCSIVAAARPHAGIVIVSQHWGPNWGYDPPAAHVHAARQLIDAGADVVYGHSPHVVRGVGSHEGKPILYSCGDFIDDYAVDPVERNDQSFMFVLDYADGHVQSLTLVPTVIREFQATLASGDERRRIEEKMIRRCADLGTDVRRTDDGLLWTPVT